MPAVFRWTIAKKIGSLIIVMVVFLLALLTHSIVSLSEIRSDMQELSKLDIPLSNISTDLEITQLELHIAMDELIRTAKDSKSDRSPFEQRIRLLSEAMYKLISEGAKIADLGSKSTEPKAFSSVDRELKALERQFTSIEKTLVQLLKQAGTDQVLDENLLSNILEMDDAFDRRAIRLIKAVEKITARRANLAIKHEELFQTIQISLGAIGILMVILLGVAITLGIKTNIFRLSRQIDTITSTLSHSGSPSFVHRNDVSSSDELGDLSNDISKLAENWTEDLDKRGKLITDKNEAEKSDLEKSQFLAAASHDLRQPLHTSNLLLELLQQKELGEEEKEIVSKIVSSMDSLTSLFNSLLDLSQLDSGAVIARPSHCDLGEIVHSTQTIFAPLAKAKGITLTSDETSQAVYTDIVLLRRIMHNLVSNAIKYTDQGNVSVSVSASSESVSIKITDTGIGIAPEQIEVIFNEYHQLNNPARERAKGIGLGLAVVKRLAAILDTEISVISQPGKGSTFSFDLPKGKAQKVTPSSVDFSSPIPKDMHIFVIDDDKNILDAMSLLLKQWNCLAYCYQSGADAKAAIIEKEIVPDALICDYRLINENGLEVIEALRDFLGFEVPALVLSGEEDKELVKKTREQHLFLLRKPVKSHLLANTLKRIISSK